MIFMIGESVLVQYQSEVIPIEVKSEENLAGQKPENVLHQILPCDSGTNLHG